MIPGHGLKINTFCICFAACLTTHSTAMRNLLSKRSVYSYQTCHAIQLLTDITVAHKSARPALIYLSNLIWCTQAHINGIAENLPASTYLIGTVGSQVDRFMHQNVIVNVDTCMLRTILGVLFMNRELERRQYHFIKIVLGKIYISVYCVDGPFDKTFFLHVG